MYAVSLVALFSLATSAWAITVTQPSQGTVWDASSNNTVSWTEVSTDPTTFAVTLVQGGVYKQTLADTVDGTKGSFSFMMSLPTGTDFQVNLVKSSQDLNTILAQSPQFNITSSGSSGSSSSTSSVTTTDAAGSTTVVSTGVGSTASSVSASLGTGLPNASSTSVTPTASHSNAAASSSSPRYGGLTGTLALFALALV